MTTRKRLAPSALGVALACVALGGAGCSTPGPLHLYSLAATASTIDDHDTGSAPAGTVPSFLQDGESLVGFAYDPFTDHFFLRLAPGNHVRVVDRPARAIKRDFTLTPLPATGGGDLAIRPRDGHVFAILPGQNRLAEFTRYGEYLRTVELDGIDAPPQGLAYDMRDDRLIVLPARSGSQLALHTPEGRKVSTIALDRPIGSGCVGFDAVAREIYVSGAEPSTTAVFGEDGRWRRDLRGGGQFFDVGPRSFIRMF